MPIVKELEKVIADLPASKAISLKILLNQFEAVRRHKKLKAYSMAGKILDNFKKSNSNSLWN